MVWVEFRGGRNHHITPILKIGDKLYYKKKNIYWASRSKFLGPEYWYLTAKRNSKGKWIWRAMTNEEHAKRWVEDDSP